MRIAFAIASSFSKSSGVIMDTSSIMSASVVSQRRSPFPPRRIILTNLLTGSLARPTDAQEWIVFAPCPRSNAAQPVVAVMARVFPASAKASLIFQIKKDLPVPPCPVRNILSPFKTPLRASSCS